MTDRRIPQISSRKQPKQARSNDLVAAILEAATQVLVKEGAPRFTTARVAEKAGVSVGSIYQYFPNKAAILFRLQRDEWQSTSRMLCDIIRDASTPPMHRLRTLVHAFVRSECAEAEMRTALQDAAPLYRDAPEAKHAHDEGYEAFGDFMGEVLPRLPIETRTLAGDLVMNTLSAVGKAFSDSRRTDAEITAYADAMADMVCAYIDGLRRAAEG
ncbi:TetR family transcriptional regulator [Luteibacter aegosomatis]|uniref:TetR family transcriptional regulator n=1 Tax=Luteibacter aegosomatis TaxID=2911537 RepID=UPI001FF761B8|nr:TetR family transcriptional regulator [Luteibacter aegosomatis]UPG84037.1 TetR family transcriptional regulator [Luteibacter aegosomatis]